MVSVDTFDECDFSFSFGVDTNVFTSFYVLTY